MMVQSKSHTKRIWGGGCADNDNDSSDGDRKVVSEDDINPEAPRKAVTQRRLGGIILVVVVVVFGVDSPFRWYRCN
jgi:hypothetical protein